MKSRISIVLLVSLFVAAFALAGEERSQMKLVLADDQNGEEIRIELDSDDPGFRLHDLQEGESRSVVDIQGRPVLITREADGFRFDVDGKSIRMPAHPEGHQIEHRVVMHGDGGPVHGPGDIMILSGAPIDDATQQAIRSLLESAGHDAEVRFIDHTMSPGGPHKVKIVEKRVEKQQD